MMTKGPKRFSVSDFNSDSAFRNKRIMAGSSFDSTRAEPSQEQLADTAPLDAQRAASSRQHVRALNNQFASWVQTQLKNHPDELWEDGVHDYIAHASNIMSDEVLNKDSSQKPIGSVHSIIEKFSDVVNWLKVNAAKGENLAAAGSCITSEKKMVPLSMDSETKLIQTKPLFSPVSTTASFTTSWSSGVFSNSQSSAGASNNHSSAGVTPTVQSSAGEFSNSQSSSGIFSSQSSPVFSTIQSSGLFPNTQSSGMFSTSQSTGSDQKKTQSFGMFINSQSSAIFSNHQSSGVFSSSPSSAAFSNTPSFGFFSNSQSSGLSSNTQSSAAFSNTSSFGYLSNSQSPGLSSNNQPPSMFGFQSSVPPKQDEADDENELEQPSSPSVEKSEEKGVVVVHEVKCKLYVKSSDPADKDAWKDKGTGQLSIKCKEGISKGTKESKPTIIVRNDVGRVQLNALLYSGIKTNVQKNSLVAIFHTAGDNDGNVVARTFLIRLKTEEDRNKLATAIQEYAPAS